MTTSHVPHDSELIETFSKSLSIQTCVSLPKKTLPLLRENSGILYRYLKSFLG
jgi:hypothetical protein